MFNRLSLWERTSPHTAGASPVTVSAHRQKAIDQAASERRYINGDLAGPVSFFIDGGDEVGVGFTGNPLVVVVAGAVGDVGQTIVTHDLVAQRTVGHSVP